MDQEERLALAGFDVVRLDAVHVDGRMSVGRLHGSGQECRTRQNEGGYGRVGLFHFLRSSSFPLPGSLITFLSS